MYVYGIIVGSVVIGFIVGFVSAYKLVKYGLDLGLRLKRYQETGQFLDEEDTSIKQEGTE